MTVARWLALFAFATMLLMCFTYASYAQSTRQATSIKFQLAPDTIRRGDSFRLRVHVVDRYGRLVSRAPVWSTSDASRATVDQRGVVYGICGGPVTIRASVDRVSASLPLQIKAPPLGNIVPILPSKMIRVGRDSIQATQLAIRDLRTGCVYKIVKWIPPQ